MWQLVTSQLIAMNKKAVYRQQDKEQQDLRLQTYRCDTRPLSPYVEHVVNEVEPNGGPQGVLLQSIIDPCDSLILQT